MPKIAYSKQQREQIREKLIVLAQELMSIQGVRHTTIEQIYKQRRSDPRNHLLPAAAAVGICGKTGTGSLAELGRSPKTLPVHLLPWRTKQDRPFDDH